MRKEVEKLTKSEDDDDVGLNIITNNNLFSSSIMSSATKFGTSSLPQSLMTPKTITSLRDKVLMPFISFQHFHSNILLSGGEKVNERISRQAKYHLVILFNLGINLFIVLTRITVNGTENKNLFHLIREE